MTVGNQGTDQEPIQQPLMEGYATPRRTADSTPCTIIEPTSSSNTFQILIENEIRDLVTHETGVMTLPHG